LPQEDEDVRGKSLDDSWGQSGSGPGAILSEPSDEEAGTNKSWEEKDKGDSWLPPRNGHVTKGEVGSAELHKGNKEDNKSNKVDSNLDWEAEAAVDSFSKFVGTNALAAAAVAEVWLSIGGHIVTSLEVKGICS